MLDPQGNSRGGSALSFNGFDVYGDLQVPVWLRPEVFKPLPTVGGNPVMKTRRCHKSGICLMILGRVLRVLPVMASYEFLEPTKFFIWLKMV